MPVRPTSEPMSSPVSVNCQVISLVGVDQNARYFRPRKFDGRQLAAREHLPHLRPRQEYVLLLVVRARLRRCHRATRSAPERVLEEQRLDVTLGRLERGEEARRVARALLVHDDSRAPADADTTAR